MRYQREYRLNLFHCTTRTATRVDRDANLSLSGSSRIPPERPHRLYRDMRITLHLSRPPVSPVLKSHRMAKRRFYEQTHS